MKVKRKLFIACAVFALGLTACGGGTSKEAAEYKIGVVQLVSHPALDAAEKGFEDGLKELGVEADIELQNAQGEVPNATTIASNFISNKVDLIYAVATPAAQAVQQQTSEVPLVFSAVTDAVEAGLVASNEAPGANVTGTSDAAPVDKQIALIQAIVPEAKKIGIIFNTAEANSRVQIQAAKKTAEALGMSIEEMGITQIADIPQACDALMPRVDAIYALTDNMVASSIGVVAEKAIGYKLPLIGAEEAHVAGGALITDGISYYEIGKQAAGQAKSILVDGKSPADIPVEMAQTTKTVYNPKTLEALGLDANAAPFNAGSPIETE